MEIQFQAHNAVISDRLRARAAKLMEKLASRLDRTVDGTVRFEREGTRCRVELILHAPRHVRLIAEGHGRYYGPALAAAATHLDAQIAHARGRSLAKAKKRVVRA